MKLELLHLAYLKRRVEAGAAPGSAKLELAALCRTDLPVADVKAKANSMVQEWLRTHAASIRKLSDHDRARVNEVRALAAEPQLMPLVFPPAVNVAKWDVTYARMGPGHPSRIPIKDARMFGPRKSPL